MLKRPVARALLIASGMQGQERIAVTVWGGRISPVLDVSTRAIVLGVQGGRLTDRSELELPPAAMTKLAILADRGIGTLLCGAVSWGVARQADSFGLRLVPFLAGDVEDVIAAYLTGHLPHPDYAMPGCQGRWRRRRTGRCRLARVVTTREEEHAEE